MAEVSDVFDAAMSIMDELSDSGKPQTTDTDEYKYRTVSIINTMIAELYPFSETKKAGKTASAGGLLRNSTTRSRRSTTRLRSVRCHTALLPLF